MNMSWISKLFVSTNNIKGFFNKSFLGYKNVMSLGVDNNPYTIGAQTFELLQNT